MKRFLVFGLAIGCAKSGSAVPSGLLDIEGTAEHAYDKALLADAVAVAADAESIAAGWQAYRDQADADGAPSADLDAMDAAVSALSAASARGDLGDTALARVANRVSAPMDELFALYDDAVPALILALDYGGREVSLDAMEETLDAAVRDLNELDSVWAVVRADVVAAGGSTEAEAYDASLARQRELATAGDSTTLLGESNNGLELVDALEGVFGG